MRPSNERLVREWYEARSRRGKPGEFWNNHVVDDLAYHLPARNPLGGEYRGKDAVRELMSAMHERSGHTFRTEILDITSSAHHVVALVRVTAEREGKSLDSKQAHVFEFCAGRISDIWIYTYDRYVVDEFWK